MSSLNGMSGPSSPDDGASIDGESGCGAPRAHPAPRHAEPAPARARRWWRSVEEKAPTPELLEALGREFPEGADLLPEGEERRTFLKLMGASAALAGAGLAGCRRWPETKVVPYAVRPADRVPGRPETFATAMEYAGVGVGLLATSYDGRPIKLDGNPESWMGRGTSTITQARLLELYNPERSLQVRKGGTDVKSAATAHAPEVKFTDADFTEWARGHFADLKKRGGEGLAFLIEAQSGPSFAALRARFEKEWPKATWTVWEPLSNDAALDGLKAAIGTPARVIPDFSRADVVVSFDDDFLNDSPLSPRFTRDFAATRRITTSEKDAKKQTLSRLYAFESTLSLTGMNADERFAVKSSLIPAIAAAVARSIDVAKGHPALSSALDALAAPFDPSKLDASRKAAFERLVEDLKGSRGRGIVLAGARQPWAVHALCAAINDALGNAGAAIRYAPALEAPCVPALRTLVDALKAKKVDTLVIVGGNPVYTAPADFDFAAAMANAPNVIHQSLEVNETSRSPACTWHLPQAHFLECWGDVRAWDHSVSIQQPLILPLVSEAQHARAPIELLAFIAGDDEATSESIVRATHLGDRKGLPVEAQWRQILSDGVIANRDAKFDNRPPVDLGAVAGALGALSTSSGGAGGSRGVELVYFNDMKVYDGRFGSIGWLQELPDPITKITWDNALLMSKTSADRQGLRKGDMVRVKAGSRELDVVVWPVPGHADDCVSIALGYGRGRDAGRPDCGSFIAKGAGFNAYALRTSDAMRIVPDVSLTPLRTTYEIAHTQDHGVSEAIDPSIPHQGIQDRLPTLVREGTLTEYRDHPDFAHHRAHVPHRLSLWEESNLDGAAHRWGLSIDLSTCTGCSACVVACQAENNIPIVGKDQVGRGRELHWIRIDRYFKGDDMARPEGFAVIPVTCMQCENAPCEQVCPVAATSHDEDGLNNMVYNRCIGTRYCSNNCPYKVRRFNFYDYQRRTPIREQTGPFSVEPEYYVETGPDLRLRMQFNPEVTVRMRGVMEKCTFCVQRIQAAKIKVKNAWAKQGGIDGARKTYEIPDGMITTACQDACPAGAIVFGDLADAGSKVAQLHAEKRSYQMLEELNTKTRLRYLARITNPVNQSVVPGGHDHGGHDHDHDDHAAPAPHASNGMNGSRGSSVHGGDA